MKTLILSAFFAVIALTAGMAQVVSDFESGDNDGWISEGDGHALWEDTTGNPGGCMRVDDDATGNMNRAYAPLKFLGDWSAAGANDTLCADIFLFQYTTPYVSSNFVFRIIGPEGQATGIINPKPPFQVWTTYKISLSPADWQLNSGTWSGLMQHVSTLIVTMEYITGDEFNRLDNVRLTFTPAAVPVLPVVCSGFGEGGFDGWWFTGTGGVSNQAAGGNPGNYIRLANSTLTAYAYAPTKFLGSWDLLDNHAAEIRLDLLITSTTGLLMTNDDFIRISGPGGAAKIAPDSGILQAFGTWHTFAFPISETAWNLESGTWDALLNQVTEIRLCMEFTTGNETVGLDNFCITNQPPTAGFTANKTFLFSSSTVSFTDLSVNYPVDWIWKVNDSVFSTDQNPSWYFDQPGFYTISLTVSNFFGSDTETKTDYIEVASVDECLKFADNFSAAPVNPLWMLHNGTWVITTGTLAQTTNYYGSGTLLDGCYAVTGSHLWSDYTISAAMKSSDNDHIGLVFNFQDFQNMYMFCWQAQTPEQKLYRWIDGTGTLLASDNIAYTVNTWYNLEAGSYKGNLILRINNTEVFNVWDTTFRSGLAGFYCYANQNSYWDNLVIDCTVPDTLTPGNMVISGATSTCFEAVDMITIGGDGTLFRVSDTAHAELVAGIRIRMLPTVKTDSGGSLHARISTDGYLCNTPPAGYRAQQLPVSLSYRTDNVDPRPLRATFRVFPNPAQNELTIVASDLPVANPLILELFDLPGKLRYQNSFSPGEPLILDLSGQPDGMYILRLRCGGEDRITKVVINR